MNTDEPKPEVKATEPKPETATPKPDPKAIELTHDTKADQISRPKSKPNLNLSKLSPKPKQTETKTEAKAAAPKKAIGNKIIFTIAILGILAGLVAAYIFGMERKAAAARVQAGQQSFRVGHLCQWHD